MYTVILVDDEPVTFKSIRKIIETRCPDFMITSVASNGKEGLEKVWEQKPDLVITDVRMPVMDGITFAQHIHNEMPDTLVLMLSGYQEFEYVRGAIESGVCNYMLKPVVPGKFLKAMQQIRESLEEKYWMERNRLMRILCQGGKPKMSEIQKYFGSKRYYAILIRKNGLPRRIALNMEYELFSIKQEQVIMYARDVMEGLYLYSEELVSNMSREAFVEKSMQKYQDGACYVTVIFPENPFQIEQMADQIQRLYRTLAERTIIGKDQVIILEEQEAETGKEKDQKDWFQEIRRLLEKKKFEYIPDEVRYLMREWKKDGKTQLWMESKVRHLFYLLLSSEYLDSTVLETEFVIEDAFFYAVSMEELEENILAEIEKKRREQEGTEIKPDTPEFFEQIKDYISEHLSEPLTLQQLCRYFGISQPYVSRFFRKYEGVSFSNYLTEARVRKAKELLRQNNDMLIKDVAFMVGYSDQFYFSRIFRSVVGVSPTEYVKMDNSNTEQ